MDMAESHPAKSAPTEMQFAPLEGKSAAFPLRFWMDGRNCSSSQFRALSLRQHYICTEMG